MYLFFAVFSLIRSSSLDLWLNSLILFGLLMNSRLEMEGTPCFVFIEYALGLKVEADTVQLLLLLLLLLWKGIFLEGENCKSFLSTCELRKDVFGLEVKFASGKILVGDIEFGEMLWGPLDVDISFEAGLPAVSLFLLSLLLTVLPDMLEVFLTSLLDVLIYICNNNNNINNNIFL